MLRAGLFVAVFVVVAGCGDDSGTGASGAQSVGGSGATGDGGIGGSGGTPVDTTPFTAEVTRYDIEADVVTLVQTASLTLDVADPGGSCFSISTLVDPGAPAFDDVPVASAEITDDVMKACSAAPLDAGDHTLSTTVTLTESTHYDLDVGFSKTTDAAGTQFTYMLSWVGGCDFFGPCDDDPSKLVRFGYDVTHPSGTTVLCPGVLMESDTVTHCEVAGTPAPTYSAFAWMADPSWERTSFVSAGGVDVVFYEVPGGGLAASLDPVSFGEFLDWATDRFGPLPYGPELRFAGAPTAWLGFEHPANIVLLEDLDVLSTSYADALTHVAMHETTHQWSGDAATIASPEDFAWKEAIAEYIPYVFEDEMRPAGEAEATLQYWDSIALQTAFHVRPTDEPPPEVQDFYGDVYGEGPMLLFVQLEDIIGRDAVLAAIASFLDGGGSRSVADLQAALEAESGEDLSTYFDTWVFGSGTPTWPTFGVETTDNGDGTLTVTVTQTQGGALFPCNVAVEIAGATTSSDAVVEFGLAPTNAVASVVIPFTEPVVTTTLDPHHRLVDATRGLSAAKLPVYIF